MPRSVHRIVAALLALWFTVVTVEPARLHSCPMHDGLALVDLPAAAGHGAGHAAHSHPGQQAPDTHHACSCIGTCATVAPPSAPVAPSFEVTERAATHLGLLEATRESSPVEYAIPFANGPPRA